MRRLSGSVGSTVLNRANDISLVQYLLTAAGASPGLADRRCGRRTVSAIVRFQAGFLSRPDGRVDVDGPTWQRLMTHQNGHSATGTATRPRQAPTQHSAAAHQQPVKTSPPLATTHAGGTTMHYRQKLPLPPHDTINVGLHSPSNAEMLSRFGEPRQSYGTDCRPPTNDRLKRALTSMQFGGTRVTGIAPAIASLRAIFADIQREQPDLVPHLGAAGMTCCRYMRGSNRSITNHSWGTAIDVTIDGVPEPFGERDVYLGLALIGPIFNRHGWYWGAGYRRVTDCHHFECGSTLLGTFNL